MNILKLANYPIGGFSPGNYMGRCVDCKDIFQGDKRAVQCEPCAIKSTTPLSVNKYVEVESFKISWDGSQYKVNIPNYNGGEVVPIEVYNKLKNSQPKVEDNSWDEVEKIFYNPDQSIGTKIAMLKAKFTLIKK